MPSAHVPNVGRLWIGARVVVEEYEPWAGMPGGGRPTMQRRAREHAAARLATTAAQSYIGQTDWERSSDARFSRAHQGSESV